MKYLQLKFDQKQNCPSSNVGGAKIVLHPILVVPKSPTIAAEGCSPMQELEKRRPLGGSFLFYCER